MTEEEEIERMKKHIKKYGYGEVALMAMIVECLERFNKRLKKIEDWIESGKWIT